MPGMEEIAIPQPLRRSQRPSFFLSCARDCEAEELEGQAVHATGMGGRRRQAGEHALTFKTPPLRH